MRIATLGFKHETNTFQSVKTDYDAFVNFDFLRGSEITERHSSTNSASNGFLKGAAKYEFELVPLLLTITGPTGTVTKDAFDRITAEMTQMLKDNGPWDGVLLAQHGGAVSEEFPDMDGEIARLVKQAVGQSTPVTMTLLSPWLVSRPSIPNKVKTSAALATYGLRWPPEKSTALPGPK